MSPRLRLATRVDCFVGVRGLVIGATVVCIGGWGEASAQEQCLVADPTGTPLNVRVTPDGQIVETLNNGTVVIILDHSSSNGRSWVYVRRNEDRAPLGWVFRDYLNCNAQEHRPFTPREAGSNETPQDAPSSESSGTGFFVAQQYVLTNHHVIKGCGRNPIWASYPDRRPERAFLSGLDETNDLALLHTDLPSTAVASFRFGPRVGESVAIYGFPLSGLLSTGGNFTMGNVTSLAGLNDDTRLLQTSAPTQPGNSGGPLLDMSGTVIGVVEGQLNALLMMKGHQRCSPECEFCYPDSDRHKFLKHQGHLTNFGGQRA
jgi:S1-C subfamily serine protease